MAFLNAFSELLEHGNIRYKKVSSSRLYSEQELVSVSGGLFHFLVIQCDGSPALALMPSDRVLCFNSLNACFGFKASGVLRDGWFCPDFRRKDLSDMPIFIDACLLKERVNIYCDTPYEYIELEGGNLLTHLNVVACQAFRAKSYKVRPKHISPVSVRQRVYDYDYCVLGVSLENDKFCGEKLRAQLRWAGSKFSHCRILVGDWMHHHTVQMNREVSEAEAKRQARVIAAEKVDEIKALLSQEQSACRYTVTLGSEVVERNRQYVGFRQTMALLLANSSHFAEAARGFAKSYVSRRDRPVADFYSFSEQYLLDELALFACLSAQGDRVFVYPGAMDIFHEISSGGHPGVPACLQQLVSVELKFTSNSQHNRIPPRAADTEGLPDESRMPLSIL